MVKLFYELGGRFFSKSSFPLLLAGAVEMLLQARGKRVIDCTVGKIQQEIHVALEDACMKKQAIREVLKGDKSMEKACKRPALYIKCSSKDKTCSCPTKKKKKHYKKWKMSKAKSRRYSRKKWKYLRKKRRFGKYKSSSCYICNRQDICYMAAVDIEGINLVNSVPHVPVSIYTFKYATPIKVIVFLDIGAAQTIMNPEVLGSALPRKVVVIGWDIITKVNKLRMTLEGVCFKLYFQPYVQTPRLFIAQEDEVKQILSELFFVRLSFKKNDDINPTKASHSGMNPEHQKLATAKCAELLQQDRIEPSNSPWAYEAFYVNKQYEQVRGKLGLVINYQTLNYFL
ncbi:hypothetical protein CRG98_043231 [Punica granatum]|uniref:Uncharacterized protein n=1 Tax=Punica granatum TaxID=22663 RepID=A0A2I0HXE2_PUNGR|nr:hypothetical protein CRG98_043231 [Punica granatum]